MGKRLMIKMIDNENINPLTAPITIPRILSKKTSGVCLTTFAIIRKMMWRTTK